MNRLSRERRARVLAYLVEGASMRTIERTESVSLNTILKLLADAGDACLHHHGKAVKGLRPSRIQADEVWSFCYAKQSVVPRLTNPPPGAGDTWTWLAIDPDSKLIVSWAVGPRTQRTATAFMRDLRSRTEGRFQLTTDGLVVYIPAVEAAFGGDVDFAQIVKGYEGRTPQERRRAGDEYRLNPSSSITYTSVHRVSGAPARRHVSTSIAERHNLTLRMHLRRFTRLTNAFSKKLENHAAAIALYTTFYNWARLHKTLRVTPAMAAGLTNELYDMNWLVGLVEARTPPPAPRGRYRRRGEGGAPSA